MSETASQQEDPTQHICLSFEHVHYGSLPISEIWVLKQWQQYDQRFRDSLRHALLVADSLGIDVQTAIIMLNVNSMLQDLKGASGTSGSHIPISTLTTNVGRVLLWIMMDPSTTLDITTALDHSDKLLCQGELASFARPTLELKENEALLHVTVHVALRSGGYPSPPRSRVPVGAYFIIYDHDLFERELANFCVCSVDSAVLKYFHIRNDTVMQGEDKKILVPFTTPLVISLKPSLPSDESLDSVGPVSTATAHLRMPSKCSLSNSDTCIDDADAEDLLPHQLPGVHNPRKPPSVPPLAYAPPFCPAVRRDTSVRFRREAELTGRPKGNHSYITLDRSRKKHEEHVTLPLVSPNQRQPSTLVRTDRPSVSRTRVSGTLDQPARGSRLPEVINRRKAIQ